VTFAGIDIPQQKPVKRPGQPGYVLTKTSEQEPRFEMFEYGNCSKTIFKGLGLEECVLRITAMGLTKSDVDLNELDWIYPKDNSRKNIEEKLV